MTFRSLQLDPKLLSNLEAHGYSDPTPIQKETIPPAMEGRDLLASADTGTGKTAAFLLPTIHKLLTSARKKGPRVLILVPTRELAQQLTTQAIKYSRHVEKLTIVTLYGGVPYPRQNKQLSRPYEILIATPGRLIDQMESGRVDLSRVETLILDEADRMLDMGFIGPVKEIAEKTSKKRQTLMFSATIDKRMEGLSRELLVDPVRVSVKRNNAEQHHIEQRLHVVDDVNHKHLLLNHILEDPSIESTLIFTSTKRFADTLVKKLTGSGHPAAAMHGNMNQSQRTRTLKQLREGKISILVATDVAARGIDISTISHVINFDVPMGVEDYVHRIGRTGRAGATGMAITFALHREMPKVKLIEKFTGHPIAQHVIKGMEPKAKSTTKPPRKNKNKSNSAAHRRNSKSKKPPFYAARKKSRPPARAKARRR